MKLREDGALSVLFRRFAAMKMSVRRIMAMAIAIGCHLCLLMAMLMPMAYRTDVVPVLPSGLETLKLRLISLPRPMPASSLPAEVKLLPPTRRIPHDIPRSRPDSVTIAPPATQAAPAATSPPQENTATAAPYTDSQPSMGDGGFRDRLLNAQRSGDVRGVPGSDTRIVPGIQLTDPANQGLGAVMRKTQRLFGVTNRHCIDVDALQKLSPEELSARHLTSADVKRDREKYDCDRPLGLSF